MSVHKKQNRFRLQFAYRAVVETEIAADSAEDALAIARSDKFLKDHSILGEGWEEADSRTEVLGAIEETPGWKFLETDR